MKEKKQTNEQMNRIKLTKKREWSIEKKMNERVKENQIKQII